jgi:hypothetical protein
MCSVVECRVVQNADERFVTLTPERSLQLAKMFCCYPAVHVVFEVVAVGLSACAWCWGSSLEPGGMAC